VERTIGTRPFHEQTVVLEDQFERKTTRVRRPLLTATPSTRTVTQFTCYRFIDAFGQPAPRPTSTSSTKTTSSISTTA